MEKGPGLLYIGKGESEKKKDIKQQRSRRGKETRFRSRDI